MPLLVPQRHPFFGMLAGVLALSAPRPKTRGSMEDAAWLLIAPRPSSMMGEQRSKINPVFFFSLLQCDEIVFIVKNSFRGFLARFFFLQQPQFLSELWFATARATYQRSSLGYVWLRNVLILFFWCSSCVCLSEQAFQMSLTFPLKTV